MKTRNEIRAAALERIYSIITAGEGTLSEEECVSISVLASFVGKEDDDLPPVRRGSELGQS